MKDNVDLDAPCAHVTPETIRHVHRPPPGCEECLKMNGQWVHLRVCLTCGHVGCCDDSPNKHATAHFKSTQHPIITSGEIGESWAWCFVDESVLSS